MKVAGLIALTLATVFLDGCSKSLNREEAARLIAGHQFFKGTNSFSIFPGEFCGTIDSFDPPDFDGYLLRRNPDAATAHARGLLEVKSSKHAPYEAFAGTLPKKCNEVPNRFEASAFSRNLTGLSYWYWTQRVTDRATAAGAAATGGAYEVAVRQFREITALSENADKTMTADFRWQWVQTDIGRNFDVAVPFADAVAGTATFKLLDDGWRLEKFQQAK